MMKFQTYSILMHWVKSIDSIAGICCYDTTNFKKKKKTIGHNVNIEVNRLSVSFRVNDRTNFE